MSDIREMLTRHECDKLVPYRCPAGRKTIGRGWNMDANPLPADIQAYLDAHGHITQEMSDRLLELSIATANRYCLRIFPAFLGLTPNRRNALLDWMFNVGIGAAVAFKKFIAAVNRGDWLTAGQELRDSAYWRQLHGDPKGTDDGSKKSFR